MRFAIFPAHVSEVLRLARKSEARSYEVLHLSNKAILPNLQIWCSKMQPLSGNQRPDLLTALMNMSLALRPPRKMHLCRSRFWKCYKTLTFCWLLTRSTIACACHAKRHLNLQKWREHVVFCRFWLWNVLRATTACNCSSLIWPDGSAPAALASLLFDPPEPQIIGKTQCFATCLPFRAPSSSFFWLFFFSYLLSSTPLLSDSCHLCFSSVHIVGSLTSKLPSIICIDKQSHGDAADVIE